MRREVPFQMLDGQILSYPIEWLEEDELDTLDPGVLETWRWNLKEKVDWIFGNLRPRICLACGEPFGVFDLHESIVSRQDSRGWSKEKRILIMCELNCIPLHHICNTDSPPSREDAWAYQAKFYSGELLLYWYVTVLPWRAGVPRRFWR